MQRKPKSPEGIEARHSKKCRSTGGGRCNCSPSYRASVYSARERRRVRKTFSTLAEARAWRQDAAVAVREGTLKAGATATLNEAAKAWQGAAADGAIRNRSGDVHKPSSL